MLKVRWFLPPASFFPKPWTLLQCACLIFFLFWNGSEYTYAVLRVATLDVVKHIHWMDQFSLIFGDRLSLYLWKSSETFWTQNFLQNCPKWPFIETKMWIIFTAGWFEWKHECTAWEMEKDRLAKKERKMKERVIGQYKRNKGWWKRVSLFLSSYIPKMRGRVAEERWIQSVKGLNVLCFSDRGIEWQRVCLSL